MNRRDLIHRLFSVVFGWSLFGQLRAYKCSFHRDLGDVSFSDFVLEQLKYEDHKGIHNLNREFQLRGKLQDIRFVQSGSKLKWEFYFRDEKSFQEWETELYRRKLVWDHPLRAQPHHIVHGEFGYVPRLKMS